MESFSASKYNFRYEFRCSCPWHQEPQEGGGKPLVCGYVKDARHPRKVAIIKLQKKGGKAFVIAVNTQGCNTTGPFSILKPLFPQIDSLLMVAEPQQVYSNVISSVHCSVGHSILEMSGKHTGQYEVLY